MRITMRFIPGNNIHREASWLGGTGRLHLPSLSLAQTPDSPGFDKSKARTTSGLIRGINGR